MIHCGRIKLLDSGIGLTTAFHSSQYCTIKIGLSSWSVSYKSVILNADVHDFEVRLTQLWIQSLFPYYSPYYSSLILFFLWFVPCCPINIIPYTTVNQAIFCLFCGLLCNFFFPLLCWTMAVLALRLHFDWCSMQTKDPMVRISLDNYERIFTVTPSGIVRYLTLLKPVDREEQKSYSFTVRTAWVQLLPSCLFLGKTSLQMIDVITNN